MKLKKGRGFSGIFALKRAPILGFASRELAQKHKVHSACREQAGAFVE
jgi:hypothetical protein